MRVEIVGVPFSDRGKGMDVSIQGCEGCGGETLITAINSTHQQQRRHEYFRQQVSRLPLLNDPVNYIVLEYLIAPVRSHVQ